MIEIQIPSELGIRDLLQFCQQLHRLPAEGTVMLDFKRMTYAPPFALLMLSTILDRARLAKPGLKFHPRHYSEHRYAGHMGFFRSCGIDYGRSPGEAPGSDSYLPITKVEVVTIRRESKAMGVPVGEYVQEDARDLARVLSRSDRGPLFDTLEYSIREIVRNTIEHSRSLVVEWCAQYWPKMDRVEIAIVDRGVGIESSLRQNPSLTIKDGHNALNLALLPGVSRNVYPGAPISPGNVWQNSGFGLYMTSRLCRLGGDFFIGSGADGIFLKGSKKEYYPFGMEGTAVRLVIRPKQIPNLRQVLKQFAEEGGVLTIRYMVPSGAVWDMVFKALKPKAPNKAPEPTPTSVMPRATSGVLERSIPKEIRTPARGMPAAVVAHL